MKFYPCQFIFFDMNGLRSLAAKTLNCRKTFVWNAEFINSNINYIYSKKLSSACFYSPVIQFKAPGKTMTERLNKQTKPNTREKKCALDFRELLTEYWTERNIFSIQLSSYGKRSNSFEGYPITFNFRSNNIRNAISPLSNFTGRLDSTKIHSE